MSESVTSDPSNDSEPRPSLEVDSPSSNVGLSPTSKPVKVSSSSKKLLNSSLPYVYDDSDETNINIIVNLELLSPNGFKLF